MEKKYFSLGTGETTIFVRVFRILFGIVCMAVAVFWLIFNIKSINADITLWITIIFLSGFGFFQVWSGLGYATRYIEIGTAKILLKKNAMFPSSEIFGGDIEKIESRPLNVIFFLKSNRRILLRFGTTYYETNEKIIDEIISFSGRNNIPFEIIEEEI